MIHSFGQSVQKFHKGDLVRIAKDLGPSMGHFESDCEAIVVGSYAEQYGGSNTNSYSVFLKGKGHSSWYYEDQLSLIESAMLNKLKEWQDEVDTDRKQKSDLDWVFSHGNDVLHSRYGASIQALANCFGLTNLWGKNGEGFVYYGNALRTLALAEPFLKSGDKDGWLSFCAELRSSIERTE